MARSIGEVVDLSVDCIMFLTMAFAGVGLGIMLIETSLEGVALIPNLGLQPEAYGHYSAQQAVVQLLFGQVTLLCGFGGLAQLWLKYRKENRD